MKTQLKSLLAIAVAVSLGLGFTSCKNDEPEPGPSPTPTEKSYVFNNSICFNTQLTEICDITIEYTDLEGKTTTANAKDLPTKSVAFTDMYGKAYEYTVHTFDKKQTTKNLPSETSLKVTFKVNENRPTTGTFDSYVAPDIYVGVPGTKEGSWSALSKYDTSKFTSGIPLDNKDRVDSYISVLNKLYGSFVAKADKDGKLTVE